MTAKVAFRGGYTCSCVAESLPLVEQMMLIKGLISDHIDIYQLGWRNDVGASAGTHSKGGNTDVGQFTDAHLKVWRTYGWTIQHRTRAQGFSMDHGHGFPHGCTHLSSSGQAQQVDWNRGRNGLISHGAIAGPGPKGSDTPSWKEGVRKMEEDLVSWTDDLAAKVKAAVLKDIGNAVWGADVIPNNFSGNAANKTVPASYALGVLGARTKDIPGAVNGWDHIPNEYDLNDPNKEIAPASALKLLLRDMRLQKAQIEAILTKLEEPQA